MAELNHEGLMDYYRCPLMYKFKHALGMDGMVSPDRRDREELERYKTTLHQTIMFFYYNIMNGKPPDLPHLQSKWFRIWDGVELQAEEVAFKPTADVRRNAKKMQNIKIEAVRVLDRFYNEELTKEFRPIIVDTDVRVQIGRHYVSGPIDLVREIKYNEKAIIELTRFTSTRYGLDSFLVNNDFRLLFQVYAFRKLFEAREDVAIIRDIRKDEQMMVSFNEEHFKRLETIVNNVGDCIDEERFHPQAMHQCLTHCEYRDLCSKYKF